MLEQLTHGFVHTNGIRMHYVEQGEGPLVLLCHGWPETWYSWRFQISALAAAGFRVIAPDQRGYGMTEAPAEVDAYDILSLTGDLVGLVNSVGEEHAAIIGHGFGSIIAASAALLRPDMFRALAMLSLPYMSRQRLRPAALWHIHTLERHCYHSYFQRPERIEMELEDDIQRSLLGILYTGSAACRLHPKHRGTSFVTFEKYTRFVDNLAFPESLPPWLSVDDLDVYTSHFGKSGFRGPINWYRNLDRNWSLTAFLDGAKILQPCIFIGGMQDGIAPMGANQYETLAINAPRLLHKTIIPSAGHWIQQEQALQTNELLREFLSDPRVVREFA